jgi:hypothetical protein
MATKFMREPKMFTTEPSVDEVGKGMKKGGKVKKMQYGGVMVPATDRPAMMPPVRPMGRRAPVAMPTARMPMRKDGGSIGNEKAEIRRVKAEMREDRKEDRNEKAEIGRVEKELKHHESMRASKAHKGMKNGGAPKAGPNVMGGLAGGLMATRSDNKKNTGGVRAPGYKSGGSLGAKMDAFETITTLKPKIDINDKVVSAKQTKSFNTKTGGVKNTTANGGAAGYKRGGKITAKGMAIAKKYMTKTNSGNPMPTVKGGTGQIKQRPAGYKDGGHVAMTCKSTGGFATMKKMAKC